jgi:putative hydrolase of the HAD superfamily
MLYVDHEEVETFIFDMDGTLFGYDDVVASINAEHKVLKSVTALSPGRPLYEMQAAFQAAFDVDRRTWFKTFLSELDLHGSVDIEETATDLETLYWVTFGKYNVPYDDALYFIDELAGHCNLGMITDGYKYNQKQKLFSSGLYDHFPPEIVVYSDDVGAMKPSPLIFERAMEKFGASPETTMFIGDKIRKDIRGGNAFGLRTVLLRRGPNAHEPIEGESDMPEIEVSSFYELRARCQLDG